MIAFVTLFLGLVAGTQPVELLVGDRVATVEVLLDHESIGVVREAPWTFLCDLGPALQPHLLEAVALDAEGGEIARARQWINMPRDPAESKLLLQGGEDGRGVVARLTWESIVGRPVAVAVSFDGQPLEVEDPERIELPEHDPRQLHFLRAELQFPQNVTSVAELTFGGVYADQISSELTAVPLAVRRKRASPSRDDLAGRLRAGDRALPVVAVETGAAELLVVTARETREAIVAMGSRHTRMVSRTRSGLQLDDALRWLAPLEKDHSVRFLSPFPRTGGEEGRFTHEVFPLEGQFPGRAAGLFWMLLHQQRSATAATAGQRLADAVAVGAMAAAARSRRRAVVLLLSGEAEDASRHSPAAVRAYLDGLRIPLRVWSTDGAGPAGWGEVTDVSTLRRLERAVAAVSDDLERQRIVWVEGEHLPQRIRLTPGDDGIVLAR